MTRSREYYDEFSNTYEAQRHRGYHRLVDDLEVDLATRYCRGRILEAGCGTGLILQRLAANNDEAMGIDLSAGMLSSANNRGLSVTQGSVDALPFPSDYFDGVCSFKVLAHVPTIERTLAELVRVTRPGGHLVLEFYNRMSLRGLIKRLKAPTRIGGSFTDEDVYTRFDTLGSIEGYLPTSVEIVDLRGVRVVTPVAQVHDVPLLGNIFGMVERFAADSPVLRRLGGFMIVVLRKQ